MTIRMIIAMTETTTKMTETITRKATGTIMEEEEEMGMNLITKPSRRSTGKIESILLSMILQSWSCVVKVVVESSILTVLPLMRRFVRKFFRRSEKSLMPRSTELLLINR